MKTTLMITQCGDVWRIYHNISKQQFPILLDMLERKLKKAPAVQNVVWHLDQ